MKFGEKIRELRTRLDMSQQELAQATGVSARTVRGWESESRYPRHRELYQKLAEVLHCEVDYLLAEEESFLTDVSEKYGSRGTRQAQMVLEQAAALFAGGDLSEEDQLAFLTELQTLYLDSKKRAGRFTPYKYRTKDRTETDSTESDSPEVKP